MFDDELLRAGVVVADTYEVERPLGRGGMGEVWLARHRRVAGKQVAIKVLRRAGDVQADLLARFKREAEIAARLEHPNIAQVLDFAALPTGEPYLVMEYLRGESLGARLRRGPLPLPEVQALVVQVGSALHVAHAAGVVHRDLKPENIFLVPTPAGDQVKVLDFGISKLIDSRTVQTSDSALMGTPLYMSPEQAMGENRKITAQSDLFSLASVCFEALSGQAPFQADNLARVVYQVAFEPSPSLRGRVMGLPEHVIKAIDSALEKQPANRTKDITAFVRDFSGVLLQGARGTGALTPTPGSSSQPAPRPVPLVHDAQGGPSMFEPTVESARIPNPDPGGGAPAEPARGAGRRTSGGLAAAVLGCLVVGGLVGYFALGGRKEPLAPHDAGAIEGAKLPELPDASHAAVEQGEDAGLAAAEQADDAGLAAVELGDDAGQAVVRPRPAPKELPLTAEQEDILSKAEAELAKGRWQEAIEWAQKPAVAETGRATALRVIAYCQVGNLGLVKANKGKVPARDRPRVVKACAANGIDF